MRLESALVSARVDSVRSARRAWLAAESASESALRERAYRSAIAVTLASNTAIASWMEVVCRAGLIRPAQEEREGRTSA